LSSVGNRRGLGRGLEVLVGGLEAGTPELLHLPVDAIHANPKQPRKRFDGEAGSGLAESVRRQGVIQPLLVRTRAAGGYEIIAGERRWRAAREAGHETIPAVVREADDRDTLLLGLVENVAREQLSPAEEARAYAVLLDEFGLAALAEEPAGNLSYGQKKLLEFATVLMGEPRLVLLDEPTAGVNPVLVEQIEERIRDLNSRGLTFLVVEHNMNLVMRLCDPVVVLDHGTKLAEGTPSQIQSDPRVLDAYLGG